MRLTNRVALISAAGSGMGRAGARRFASEGAHVVVTDIDVAAARETVSLIAAEGGSAEALRMDVTSVDEIRAVIKHVDDVHGVLHVLYNHAGIPGPGILDAPLEDFDRGMEVNLKGAYYLAAAATPLMRRARGTASIIFTSSTAGLVGSPLSPFYSMTKGGIVLLTRSLAVRLGVDGIRVNAICPGMTDTPMLPQFFSRESQEDVSGEMDDFLVHIPLGRRGTPEEIASAALFLACDESSFITGVALPVDGGYVAK
jgi:NAD(P)-dependent dehydrogenase (short-subunit alcohol dehydrogenase family)